MSSQNIILEKSFDFAIKVVKVVKMLQEQKNRFIVSKQLMRSGTSVGANVREAHNAESKKDFIHKMAIAQNQTDETKYWVQFLSESNYVHEDILKPLYADASALLKSSRSKIISTKQNMHNS